VRWRNTKTGFGLLGKLLHWGLALLIFEQIALGLYLANTKIGLSGLYLYGWHKALGMLALAFIILRVFWRLSSFMPEPHGPDNWQVQMAKALHRLLYLLMLLIPLSGWIASSASGFPMRFFGLFPLPVIVPVNETVEEISFAIHGYAGKLLIAVLLLHIAGALQRQFIKGDGTLRRMWF